MSNTVFGSLESPAANGASAYSLASLNPLLRHHVIYKRQSCRWSDVDLESVSTINVISGKAASSREHLDTSMKKVHFTGDGSEVALLLY